MRGTLNLLTAALSVAAMAKPTRLGEPSYLPDAAASRIVTVTESGTAAAGITVLTEAVAIKETGPRATVARFGEVYAFAPAFVAVHHFSLTLCHQSELNFLLPFFGLDFEAVAFGAVFFLTGGFFAIKLLSSFQV